MCGIAGKVSPSDPIEPRLLEGMCQVLEHRGPDSRGTYVEGGVGLGVQRLAIIDLETGDQPIFNEDRSLVVVLNGEIYNYRELREQLTREGHRFATRSDTEVIVHLYEKYGDSCVQHLRGMFAFALWDRGGRRLLIGRDRIGKKPLFYAYRGRCLWFGSEAKAILQDPAVPRDVDHHAIDSFLQYQYVPSPRSAFAALRKLPPAHLLTWKDGRIAIRRYWKLSYETSQPAASEPELQDRIRSSLLDATRMRLRSDVPLGAFLSGGVDSSAVVAAMARQGSGRVRTFSIGFDVEKFDETPYAREVARLYDTEHHEFKVEPNALEVLPRLVWHYGEPFADHSAIPTFHLAELARRHVTVALNGDGGDENFAGYPRYLAAVLAKWLEWVPAGASRVGEQLIELVGRRVSHAASLRRARRLLRATRRPLPERYAEWLAFFTEQERAELYEPEFRALLGERRWLEPVEQPYLSSDADNLLERLLDVDVHSYLPGDLLVKMDIATMANSLEVRSPMLDHRFMEMAAALPAETKLQRGRHKRLFKDALRDWLPDRILGRPKMGFTVPLAEWFRGALRRLPEEVLLDRRSVERGLFREEGLRRLIREHVEGVEDNSNKLWALLQLELWLRTWVDGARADSPVAVSVR